MNGWTTNVDTQWDMNETVNVANKNELRMFVRSQRWFRQFREISIECIVHNENGASRFLIWTVSEWFGIQSVAIWLTPCAERQGGLALQVVRATVWFTSRNEISARTEKPYESGLCQHLLPHDDFQQLTTPTTPQSLEGGCLTVIGTCRTSC